MLSQVTRFLEMITINTGQDTFAITCLSALGVTHWALFGMLMVTLTGCVATDQNQSPQAHTSPNAPTSQWPCPGMQSKQLPENVIQAFDGTRSIPEAVLNPKHPDWQSYNQSFCYRPAPNQAPDFPESIETAMLKDGRTLVVRNTGWESIVLVYEMLIPESLFGEKPPDASAVWAFNQAREILEAATHWSRSEAEFGTAKPNQEIIAYRHTVDALALLKQRLAKVSRPPLQFSESLILENAQHAIPLTLTIAPVQQVNAPVVGRKLTITLRYGPL